MGGGGSVQDKGIKVFSKGEQKSSGSVGSGTAPQAVMAIKVAAYDEFPISCQLVKKLLIQVSSRWVVDVEKIQVVEFYTHDFHSSVTYSGNFGVGY